MLKSKPSITVLGMMTLLSLSVLGCSSNETPASAEALPPEDAAEEVVEVDPVEAETLESAGDVPQEAVDALSPEIDLITLDWAPGRSKPTLGKLMPHLVDAEVRGFNEHGQFVFVAPWMGDGLGVIVEGDVAILAGTYWQCGWLEEYFRAVDSGDTKAAEEAAGMLGELRNFEPVTRYSEDFSHAYQSAFAPAFRGDDADARARLSACHEMGF